MRTSSAKTTFTQLTVELPEADEELAQLLLHEGGATAVEVRDSESPPLPGVTAPRPGEALLVAAFERSPQARSTLRKMKAAFPKARATLEALPNQDWSTQWRARVRAVEVDRLWVGPPWMRRPHRQVRPGC